MNEADQPVDVELTHEERHMLASGLTDWGGPVLPTPAQAREMGFANRDDLYNTGERSPPLSGRVSHSPSRTGPVH